jgi:hypothetical protein
MAQNVGSLDSTIRVGIGFGLIFTGLLLPPPASVVAYVAGLAAIVSGFAGQCLLYRVLGINTCEGRGGSST